MLIGAGEGKDSDSTEKTFSVFTDGVDSRFGGSYLAQTRNHAHTFEIKGKTTEVTTIEPSGTADAVEKTFEHIIESNEHSHNIPVTVLSTHDNSNRGYLTDPQTFGTWCYPDDDSAAKEENKITPSYNNNDSYNTLFLHFNSLNGEGWGERYWQFFEEKGKQIIPTVSAGTWWPDWNKLAETRWNKPGYVRTGYQYVDGFNTFEKFREKCRDAWRDWFTIAPVDCTKRTDEILSKYPHCRFVHETGRDGGEFPGWNTNSTGVRDYWMPKIQAPSDYQEGTEKPTFGVAKGDDGIISLSQGWYNDSIRVNPKYNGSGSTGKLIDSDFKIKDIEGKEFKLSRTQAAVNGSDPHMDNIRDAFIMDWLRHHARQKETDGNGDFFKLRKDDGAHTHACNDHTYKHAHTLTLDDIPHNHALNIAGLKTASDGGDPNASNLPPYQVCYIWTRTN
jgi:hypothetical protein